MRIRFEVSDLSLVLDVAAAEDEGRHVRWSFEGADWEPRLRVRMTAEVANRFFQGRESLAIGVVRGRVVVSGDPRFTLIYVPALRLLTEPYRRAVADVAPALVL